MNYQTYVTPGGGHQWFATGKDPREPFYQGTSMHFGFPQGVVSYPYPPYLFPGGVGQISYPSYYMTGQQYAIGSPGYYTPSPLVAYDRHRDSEFMRTAPPEEQHDSRVTQCGRVVSSNVQQMPAQPHNPSAGYGYQTSSPTQVPGLGHSASRTPLALGMAPTPATSPFAAGHAHQTQYTAGPRFDGNVHPGHKRGYSQLASSESWPSVTSAPPGFAERPLEMASVTSSFPSHYGPKHHHEKKLKYTDAAELLPPVWDWPSVTSIPSAYGLVPLEMASVTSVGDSGSSGTSGSDSEEDSETSSSDSGSESTTMSHSGGKMSPRAYNSARGCRWERQALVNAGLRRCRLCHLWTARPDEHVCTILGRFLATLSPPS